jgi:hypothetical protein
MGKTIFTCVYIGGKKSLKIFSKTSRPISIKLDTCSIKGIQVCANKGQVLFKEEIIAKIGWDHLIFCLKIHWPRKPQIYIKASQYSAF